MLSKNIINNTSETYKITSLSQLNNNLEKVKNYLKLEISLL